MLNHMACNSHSISGTNIDSRRDDKQSIKMQLFDENKDYVLVASVSFTILVVIASLIYTFRNVLRIWNAGKSNAVGTENKQTESENEESGIEESDENTDEKCLDDKSRGDREIDPVQYCEHIQSEVKKARQRAATKEIRQNLTAEDMQTEREIQRKQLEDIFRLMEQNSEKFGATSEDDVQQQMRLYI